MTQKSDYDFQYFNMIRRVARELFVNGYRGNYADFIDLASPNKYRSRVNRIFYSLDQHMSWDEEEKKWMTTDQMRICNNPLYYLFKSRSMDQSDYALYFSLIDMLSDGSSLSLAQIYKKIDRDIVSEEILPSSGPELENRIRQFISSCSIKKGEKRLPDSKSFVCEMPDNHYRLITSITKTRIEKMYAGNDLALALLHILSGKELVSFRTIVETMKNDPSLHNFYALPAWTIDDGKDDFDPSEADQITIRQGRNKQTKKTTLYNILKEYCDIGILVFNSEDQTYSLPSIKMFDLLKKYPGLATAIAFFSEYSPLGIVGSYLMDEFDLHNKAFVFKNQYIAQAIDSIVLYDLLTGIKNRFAATIYAEQFSETLEKESLIIPIKIFSRTVDGRQYVYAYDINKKKFFLARIDNIYAVRLISPESINDILGKEEKTMGELIHEGIERLPYIWSSDLGNTPKGVSVCFLDNDDTINLFPYISRESRSGTVKKTFGNHMAELRKSHGYSQLELGELVGVTDKAVSKWENGVAKPSKTDIMKLAANLDVEIDDFLKEAYTITFSTEIYRPLDLVPWVLGYTGKIATIQTDENDDGRLIKRVTRHIDNLHKIYSKEMTTVYTQNPTVYLPNSESELGSITPRADRSELFQPHHSKYIACLKGILEQVRTPRSEEEISRIISDQKKRYGIGAYDREISFDKMADVDETTDDNGNGLIKTCLQYNINSGIEQKNAKDARYIANLFSNNSRIQLPLDRLESRWIVSILNDPMINLFLNEGEIDALKLIFNSFDPLYRQKDIIYIDQYKNGDPFQNAEYIAIGRSIFEAIESKASEMIMQYQTEEEKEENKCSTYYIKPLKIEYSRQNNTMLLLGTFTQDPPEGAPLITHGKNDCFYAKISNIKEIRLVEHPSVQLKAHYEEEQSKVPIVLKLFDIYHAFDRFHTMFATYRKKTILSEPVIRQVSEEEAKSTTIQTCVVTLWYSKRDKKEIMQKLRTFGEAIVILGPKEVRKTFARRVNEQYQIFVQAGLIQAGK